MLQENYTESIGIIRYEYMHGTWMNMGGIMFFNSWRKTIQNYNGKIEASPYNSESSAYGVKFEEYFAVFTTKEDFEKWKNRDFKKNNINLKIADHP